MSSNPRRRQVRFFLIAVILPSAVLVALGAQLLRQEHRLAIQQRVDERLRIVEEARESLFGELERLQRSALDAAHRDPAGFVSKSYATGIVLLAARIDGGELRLPWTEDPLADRAARALHAAPFAQQVAAAGRTEFADGDVEGAIQLYRSARAQARDSVQTAYADLLLGRAFAKAGMRTQARSQNRRLLELPSSVRDEVGVPISIYAADRLAQSECCDQEWLERVGAMVNEPRWRSPVEAHLLRDLLDRAVHAADSNTVQRIAALERTAEAEIVVIERAMKLRDAFPGLGLRSSNVVDAEYGTPWVRYADEWLVGAAPMEPESRGVVAIALNLLPDVLPRSRGWPAAAEISIDTAPLPGGVGAPLDPAIPGVSIVVADASLPGGGASRLLRGFYVGTLLLVLSVTLFGAYLFWFDVQRELRIGELRAQFVSSVSHELKTPLTAIRMFAERLRMKQHPDTKMQTQYLNTIVGESERLTRLIDNVLDLSKIEQEQKRYRSDPVLLADVVDRTVRALGYQLTRRGFTLNVDVRPPAPTVRGDVDALEQAVLNLVSNAMKYSGDSRAIDLRLFARNGDAVIEVVDRGVGIPAHLTERLTEKFFRVPTPENERIPGTGLGLALVHHTVSAHGGRLVVSSQEGEGSTFAIFLPLEAS